ncbi:MAG: shikimate kinase [Spirochaetia bacterium]|nr:shikimate kinase [Spirochaetia bacterium]MBP5739692.1 shikimate kinase [Spirochaetia bacterium]
MKYGLVGAQLGHSYSPFIHTLLGSSPYDLVSLSHDQLGSFLKAGDFEGLNITIPYKKAVIPYLDHIAPEAEAVGAVNTIVHRQDGLWGYNTDCYGFLYAAERAGIAFDGKKVLVLGSGGASAAVKKAAAGAGAAEVLVVSRTGELNYSNVYDEADVEIVVNATPVGMYPDNGGRLIDISRFPRCSGVIDLIYNPLMTPLLLDARELGIPYTNGLSMLVAQAKYASDLFFGIQRPDSIIDGILKKTEQKVSNIVLVGMPGCGKSTVGKILAASLEKGFVDTDLLVEQKAGKSIPDIFKDEGEAYFRTLEANVIASVCKEGRQVIATGGGAVLNPGNVDNMRQNGIIVYLKRDIKELSTEGRPLSQQESLDAMLEKRRTFYEAASDIMVNVPAGPDETAALVTKELGWV